MSTHRNDVDVDVIPEFDFSRAIPNPFLGLIGPSYTIRSHGTGSDQNVRKVVVTERPGGEWVEFVHLDIPRRRVARSGIEWIARDAIGRFLGIDGSSFDLIIEVRSSASR